LAALSGEKTLSSWLLFDTIRLRNWMREREADDTAAPRRALTPTL
jgi:hypothetical protein